jgi:hypothetical protein
MKNTFLNYIKISFAFCLLLQAGRVEAQSFVTWNAPTTAAATPITGSYTGGTVTVSQGTTGAEFTIGANAFANNYTGLNSASTNQAFYAIGKSSLPPSKSMVFTFSSPVIINSLYINDIDKGATWDDTFTFSGITFTSASSTNCTSTTTGATATTDAGTASEYASWSTSTTAVTSFTINFATTGGYTHAVLSYAMQVTAVPGCSTAPTLSATTITASNCPTNTVNLNSLVTSTLPTGATLKWYTDASRTTEVTTPTAVGTSGTYYAFYNNTANNCFSPASAAVTVTANCPLNLSTACPAITIDLASRVSSTPVSGYTTTYHSGTPATTANKLSSSVVTASGTYYAASYFAAQDCYTTTSRPIVVTITNCCTTVAPPKVN